MARLSILATTTETEAVNAMLAAIGEAPIASVDTTDQPDVEIALGILKELMREIQTEGWRFNTRFGVVLSPSSTLNVGGTVYNVFPVPANMLRFDAGSGVSALHAESIGAVVFYDTAADRPGFSSPTLTLGRAVYLQGWNGLPETARQYILKVAINEFIQRVVGSETLSSFAERDILRAQRFLQRDQGIRDRSNLFRGSEYSDFLGGRS